MARITLATGRIHYDEEDEDYYFTTEDGEKYVVPFEKMDTGPGKFIYEEESASHHIITESGEDFAFRNNGRLQANGVDANEVYGTVVGTKNRIPKEESVILPEAHQMIVDGPYTIDGEIQIDGKLVVL